MHKATNVSVNCQYRALTNSGAEGYSPGRPHKRPKKLHDEKGSDFRRCRVAVERGVAQAGHKIRSGRCTVDSSERLGRCRWVVERTLSWLARYRRLKVRHERRADVHHQAFLDLGCALIYWNHVQRYC